MTVDVLWSWFGVAAVALGAATGVWWALADFILDHVGPAPARWRDRDAR
jgi:hypothetical protein